jgi:repressor LexA
MPDSGIAQKLLTLTDRQREIYEFIRSCIFDRGYGPTVRETADQFSIRSPNGVMCHLRALEKKGLISREPNMSRAIQLVDEGPSNTGMPLAGVIAAGQPIEAVEQPDRIDFRDMFGNRDLFALQVRGRSMIEDQIADGDYVVVHKQQTARDGQIVAAVLDGGEATLKRFFREPNRVRLEPANREMKPIYTKSVRILGVVVGVVRRYL